MDHSVVLKRLFEEVINNGNLDVADELFADDFVDHGPMGDIHGRDPYAERLIAVADGIALQALFDPDSWPAHRQLARLDELQQLCAGALPATT